MSQNNLKINNALKINKINDRQCVIELGTEQLEVNVIAPNPFKSGSIIDTPTVTLLDTEVQLDYVSKIIVAAFESDISTVFKDTLLDWQFALIEKRRTFD